MAYDGCPCFWVEMTGRAGIRLRRFVFSSEGKPCTGKNGYHDASSEITAYEKLRWEEQTDHGKVRLPPRSRSKKHRAWPKVCECGYRFEADDEWQTNADPEWKRADTGDLLVCEAHVLPAGALWHMDWTPLAPWTDRYGDGVNLYAMCPNGSYWNVDGPAYGGGEAKTPEAWSRTGDPRRPLETQLSAMPSIIAGDYHGWLANGIFSPG